MSSEVKLPKKKSSKKPSEDSDERTANVRDQEDHDGSPANVPRKPKSSSSSIATPNSQEDGGESSVKSRPLEEDELQEPPASEQFASDEDGDERCNREMVLDEQLDAYRDAKRAAVMA